MTTPGNETTEAANDFFNLKYQVLLEEWKLANSNIGRLDSIVFTIRGWAVALTTGGVGFAAYTKPDPRACLLIVAPILVIWFIDGLFKSFQRVFIERSREIEKYLSSDNFSQDYQSRSMTRISTPVLASRFGVGSFFSRLKGVLKQLFIRNVLATYLPLLFLSLISYALVSVFALQTG